MSSTTTTTSPIATKTTAPTTTTASVTDPAITSPAKGERAQPLKVNLQKKEKLQAALDAVLEKWAPKLPGIAFGVTTGEGAIYAGYAGDRVYGEPDHGQIGKDTSESPSTSPKTMRLSISCSYLADTSVHAVQHDEADHVPRCRATGRGRRARL